MEPAEFPGDVEHRPWPIPSTPWVMAQKWHDLLFAHYPIPIERMRELVPPELEIDTFDGKAWLGVVPFRMTGIRPRFCPSLPWLSNFLEFNIRTYVRARKEGDEKPGVYFFSLDAANPVAVSLARATFHLPYFRAAMNLQEREGERIEYSTKRTHRGAAPAEYAGSYGPTGKVFQAEKGSIDHWLTERYCLYTVHQRKVYRGEIHHSSWPLQPAFQEVEISTMAEASGFDLPDCEPLLHFSRKIDVVVWPIENVKLHS